MNIFNKIDSFIEEKEILRLLEYKDAEMGEEIHKCIKEEIGMSSTYIRPVVYYEKVNIKSIEKDHVVLENEVILQGKFIADKLKGCKYIIATVTTLGNEIDIKIKEAFDSGDFLKGITIDNIGITAINYADKTFWNTMIDHIKESSIGITSRLSPGDTEWTLDEQKKVFKCIGENFTAVTLTESSLMMPIKSTSAIYGFGENIGIARLNHVCSECNMKRCAYRMDKKAKLIIHSENGREIIYVKSGEALLEVLRNNRISIDSHCNGKGTCGKCKVKIINGLKEHTYLDEKHLTKKELESGFRLSCNVTINEDIEIVLPEKNENMKVLITGEEQQYDLDTVVKKKYIVIDKPSIEDQRDDHKRLSDACEKSDLFVSLRYLPKIGDLLRKADFNITATLYKSRLLHLESGNCLEQNYGLAIDIGTTTIAAYLLNLNDGKVLDVESKVNNQRSYGADVISRINFTIENPKGLGILKDSIINQLNDMIELLCKKNNIREDNIYDTVIVGNTTMIHLLLGLPCINMALAPYIPLTTEALEFEAKELGIKSGGMVSLVPGISSYVGSDITAGIVSSGMLNSEKYSLLLDLGTNGEIALGNKNEVITCSTAAGPAFEGANIKYGIGGIEGAISNIDLSKDKIYETIGNVKPCGICGSGVLDAVAQLLKFGIVDETGRMLEKDEIEQKDYQDRLIEIDKMRQFVLAYHSIHEGIIAFTQKDVREVQLAKAAVCAGIRILLKEKNINFDEIEKVYIGGGFGNYMNIESSLAIGMIPKELKGKIKSVGNCAGSGAKMYLMSKRIRENTVDIINKATYIELSKRGDFQEYFVDAMMME